MTIREAVERIDTLRPNGFTYHDKIMWLNTLDGRIYEELIRTHEGGRVWRRYTDDTDGMTELLAASPYDDMYLSYLGAQISFYNNEIGQHNNDSTSFNARYSEFAYWYNRTHMPKTEAFCYYGDTKRTAFGGFIGKAGERIADPLSD